MQCNTCSLAVFHCLCSNLKIYTQTVRRLANLSSSGRTQNSLLTVRTDVYSVSPAKQSCNVQPNDLIMIKIIVADSSFLNFRQKLLASHVPKENRTNMPRYVVNVYFCHCLHVEMDSIGHYRFRDQTYLRLDTVFFT